MTRVMLFGHLAALAGWRDRMVEAKSLSGLLDVLAMDDPALANALWSPGVQVAIDRAIVRGDADLATTTEVAFLPPMSGG
jgi:molybdopterin synthase sulfur carrier subunit